MFNFEDPLSIVNCEDCINMKEFVQKDAYPMRTKTPLPIGHRNAISLQAVLSRIRL